MTKKTTVVAPDVDVDDRISLYGGTFVRALAVALIRAEVW
jgi:hypothetical protein